MEVLTPRRTFPPEQTKEGLRKLVLTDLFALARRVLYPAVKTPMSRGFHRPVCDFRARSPYQRNLYLLSRDHLKTSVLTVAGNVQRILRDPQTRILLASDKLDAASAQLAEIKGHLVNPLLLWLFPDVLWQDPERQAPERWTTTAITVKRRFRSKEATVETIGVEGAATGRHYDHGSFDDLVDEQNSLTKDGLEKVIHWYQTTQSLFEPAATQEIVGTPWAFGDLYDWLIAQKLKREFRLGVYRQPCWMTRHPGELRVGKRGEILEDEWVLDAQGNKLPAFPEKHTRESMEERQRVNGRLFAAQWLLRPVDDESAVFPRSKAIIRPRGQMPSANELFSVMAVDPAISIKERADYSALGVAGFDRDGNMNVLDLRRGHWQPSELVENVYDSFHRNPGILIIGFEAVGFQKLYLREFARAGETRGYLPIVKLERDNRTSKPVRISSLEPLWRSGQIILATNLPALDDFLEEAERFRTWKESLHDDMLDALADCLQLRIRPIKEEAQDHDEERAMFEREHAHLLHDRASMRNAWQMKKRRELWDQAREEMALEALGGGNDFFAAGG